MILPSKFGKAKASLQFWAVGFVMMDFSFSILSFDIADLIVLHALIFSYISGYQYISGYIQKTK
jgi:phosphatidylglycerophosphate synthase